MRDRYVGLWLGADGAVMPAEWHTPDLVAEQIVGQMQDYLVVKITPDGKQHLYQPLPPGETFVRIEDIIETLENL